MGRTFKCPCGASNSVAKGFRRTISIGVRRIRRCRSCGRKFTPKHQRPLGVTAQSDNADGKARDDAQQPSAPQDDAEADVVL